MAWANSVRSGVGGLGEAALVAQCKTGPAPAVAAASIQGATAAVAAPDVSGTAYAVSSGSPTLVSLSTRLGSSPILDICAADDLDLDALQGPPGGEDVVERRTRLGEELPVDFSHGDPVLLITHVV